MAMMTWAEYIAALIEETPGGYITGFQVDGVGTISFETSLAFGTNTVHIKPGPMSESGRVVQDGIIEMAGGRLLSPWSMAGRRAPVGYSTYTQQVIYVGNIPVVILQSELPKSLIGTTGKLHFNYGRTSENTWASGNTAKWCDAMLIGVTVGGTLPLNPTLTDVETARSASLTWRQVGPFYKA